MMNKFSIIGIILGVSFSLASFIRYYLGLTPTGYVDVDKAIAYVIIGLLWAAVWYLYNEKLVMRKKIKRNEERIDNAWDEFIKQRGVEEE